MGDNNTLMYCILGVVVVLLLLGVRPLREAFASNECACHSGIVKQSHAGLCRVSQGVGGIMTGGCKSNQVKSGGLCYDTRMVKQKYGVGKPILLGCPAGTVKVGGLCYKMSLKPKCAATAAMPSCQQLSNSYAISAGKSWGRAGATQKSQWSKQGCNTHPQSTSVAPKMYTAGWNGKCRAGYRKKCLGICGASVVQCHKI